MIENMKMTFKRIDIQTNITFMIDKWNKPEKNMSQSNIFDWYNDCLFRLWYANASYNP